MGFQCFLELAFLSWALGDLLLKRIAGLKTPPWNLFSVSPPLRRAVGLASMGWGGENKCPRDDTMCMYGPKENNAETKREKKENKKGEKRKFVVVLLWKVSKGAISMDGI